MAPISKLLSGWLCGLSNTEHDPAPHDEPPNDLARPRSGSTRNRLDDAPHELPALTFSPPLSAPELSSPVETVAPPGEASAAPRSPSSPAGDTQLPPPSSAAQPKLAQLLKVDSPAAVTHSVTPPTPIDPTPTPSPTTGRSRSSTSRPSTPPSSTHTPEASTSTAAPRTPHLTPPPAPHALALTPADAERRSRSPARGESRHHRRSSSQGTTGSRSFRETLNAYAVEAPDGSRSVNQYVLGETLGRGSYATVEKAVDRETGGEYVRRPLLLLLLLETLSRTC